MSRHLSVNRRRAWASALSTLALGCSLAACGPGIYVPPSESQPHADVTVRIIHHDVAGPTLEHQTLIDETAFATGIGSSVAPSAPVTRSVRVRPVETGWQFRSQFSHSEMRTEHVMEEQRYPCGTQRTGIGRSARQSTRYCTRMVPRVRSRMVRIVDGTCETGLRFTPAAGTRYVLQYDYHGNESCRARCFERSRGSGGRFALRPCQDASALRAEATP